MLLNNTIVQASAEEQIVALRKRIGLQQLVRQIAQVWAWCVVPITIGVVIWDGGVVRVTLLVPILFGLTLAIFNIMDWRAVVHGDGPAWWRQIYERDSTGMALTSTRVTLLRERMYLLRAVAWILIAGLAWVAAFSLPSSMG